MSDERSSPQQTGKKWRKGRLPPRAEQPAAEAMGKREHVCVRVCVCVCACVCGEGKREREREAYALEMFVVDVVAAGEGVAVDPAPRERVELLPPAHRDAEAEAGLEGGGRRGREKGGRGERRERAGLPARERERVCVCVYMCVCVCVCDTGRRDVIGPRDSSFSPTTEGKKRKERQRRGWQTARKRSRQNDGPFPAARSTPRSFPSPALAAGAMHVYTCVYVCVRVCGSRSGAASEGAASRMMSVTRA